ncbi:imidazoleglycerol-phosphate dehydratase HisB [Prochlorococcus sp. MIT 1223]|uniref:imidazoleglycerol-phosphate dehydratase HisB n=1 Tax=Prochlorococcus sp. MIT 1223 TaxID=3096217 RepID=UPI002A74DFC3|nr:imidazoleglycerol-phosphate dehydratase HisB [Prochlorococcus sp. MIT 1223]
MTSPRQGEIHRVTKETDVFVRIDLDGKGVCKINTGIPFLDHMLQQISSHGLFDLEVTANGDTHIDDHHTNEDVGIAFGQALSKALGNRSGIFRFGHFMAPLDEALIQVVLDCSGRPHLAYGLKIPVEKVGSYDTELVKEFFGAVVNNSGLTLHIRQIEGSNAHHIIEACFKSFSRALRMAVEYDQRRNGSIPSSKGVLEQAG